MNFRSVQTSMWRVDGWFETLSTDARLLWIYLFTNPSSSPAGIYRLTLRTMSNESGIPLERIAALMAEFSAAGKAYYQDGVVWVVNMRRLQVPGLEGSGAWQIARKIREDIELIPDHNPLKERYCTQIGYPVEVEVAIGGKPVKRIVVRKGYPMDMVSIPYRYTDTDTDTDTDTITPFGSGASAPQPQLFDGDELPGPELAAVQKGKGRKKTEPVPPGITWFRAQVGRYPPKELWPRVEAIIQARQDEALFKSCWETWVARGHSRMNYDWFLDWYQRGVIPAGKEQRNATIGKAGHARYSGANDLSAEEREQLRAALNRR